MNRKQYLKEYQKKWRKRNREYCREQERKRYHSKPKAWKDAQVLKNKKYRHKIRLEVLKHYGGKCTCCGESIKEFLCFDHINNNGASHRKTMKDKSIAPWLKRNNYPKEFRVLCHNCNMAIGLYGYCPHRGGDAK